MSAASFDLTAALGRPAERVLARLIGESSTAARLAAELEGATFTVLVEGLSAGVQMTVRDGRVQVRPLLALRGLGPDGRGSARTEHADMDARPRPPARSATLTATPIDLVRLLRGRGLANLRATRAEIAGSVHVAESFAALLEHARPDLEEELSRFVGDYAAHALGTAARRTSRWLRRAVEALALDTAEYLQEESSALPAATEARAFYADVERLRDDVDRAAARLALLAARGSAAASRRRPV